MLFSSSSLICAILLLLSLQRIESVVGDWNQVGSDLDGEAGGDQSGRSVVMSADGKTIAVGANENENVNGINAGHVRVYKWNETPEQYTQFGPDINGAASCANFGISLALSADGNTIAVGAPENDVTGEYSGSVQLFRANTQSSIVQYQQIGGDILGEGFNDNSGHSLAMSADGTIFVVGAPGNDGNGNAYSAGHARVFKLDSSSPQGFSQIGPDLDGTVGGDQFGFSVAMSADGITIAVGGIGGTNAGYVHGYVRVYKLIANINQYSQIGTDIVGESAQDQSGYSLAMSADGSAFAVGAPFNDGNGINSGHVRVYKIDPSGQTYIQIGFDIDGGDAGDRFGTSVATSSDGTTIAVGAVYNYRYGLRVGHVRVYRLDPTVGIYMQIGNDIYGERAGDIFGYSIDMSSDGTMIVVGAISNDDNGVNSGHVRVFRYSPVPTKTPTKSPTKTPTRLRTKTPTRTPLRLPTKSPTRTPTKSPTKSPIKLLTKTPTRIPTKIPTRILTKPPTKTPTKVPTKNPTKFPMRLPTKKPSKAPVAVACGFFCSIRRFLCRIFGLC